MLCTYVLTAVSVGEPRITKQINQNLGWVGRATLRAPLCAPAWVFGPYDTKDFVTKFTQQNLSGDNMLKKQRDCCASEVQNRLLLSHPSVCEISSPG